jgi:Protein of unknown function (DUF2924)
MLAPFLSSQLKAALLRHDTLCGLAICSEWSFHGTWKEAVAEAPLHGSEVDRSAIEAEIGNFQSLNLDALRTRWRVMFGAIPPKGLTKDIIARMIAYRVQEEIFGGLDRETVKILNQLSNGQTSNELSRRLKPGEAVTSALTSGPGACRARHQRRGETRRASRLAGLTEGLLRRINVCEGPVSADNY